MRALGTAIASKCTILVTNDEKLKSEAKKIPSLKTIGTKDVTFSRSN